MRRVMVASVVALVAVTGYAAADVFDVVPGILTLDRPAGDPNANPTSTASGVASPAVPEPAATVDPLLTDSGAGAPAPTRAGLARALTTASGDSTLKGVTGRDAQDLVVAAGLVAHVEHADRARAHQAAGEGRLVEQHQRV